MFVLLVFGNPRSFSFSNISFFTIAFCLLWISCARKPTKTLWQKIKKYVCTLESLVYNNLVRTIFRQVRSDGMVAQPGERPPHTREVTGSSPVHPISFVPEPVRIRGFLVLYDYLQSARSYYASTSSGISRQIHIATNALLGYNKQKRPCGGIIFS